ncbi:MAG: FHA domain-containing protein [Planctomycetota bacterium]
MPLLRVQNGSRRWNRLQVPDDGARIGRSEDCGLVLDDPWISREHASIEPVPGGGFRLVDLGSENGTFVNGKKVTERLLANGDVLRFGGTEVRYLESAGARGEGGEGARVRRLEELVAELRDENRRLRRLAAEAGARAAKETPRSRGRRVGADSATRSLAAIEIRPRFAALGRRGLELARGLRDFGLESVGAVEVPPPGRGPEDGLTPGERLLDWLDLERAPRGWFLTSSRALEIWVPDPEVEVSIGAPGSRGPVLALVRDEGALTAILPWFDWLARAGAGPLFVGSPATEPRGAGPPGDGVLGLAAVLAEFRGEGAGEPELLEGLPPEGIHLLGAAAAPGAPALDALLREAREAVLHRGLDPADLPLAAARLRVGRDLARTSLGALEQALGSRLSEGPTSRIHCSADEGTGARLALALRHPLAARP